MTFFTCYILPVTLRSIGYYDAEAGRWTARDPKEQFLSSYVAFGNNPMNSIDPTGQETTIEVGMDSRIQNVDFNIGSDDVWIVSETSKDVYDLELREHGELDVDNYTMDNIKNNPKGQSAYKGHQYVGDEFDSKSKNLMEKGIQYTMWGFFQESKQDGILDLKGSQNYGDQYVLGFLGGKLMDTRDAGNQIWGQIGSARGYSLHFMQFGAGANNLAKRVNIPVYKYVVGVMGASIIGMYGLRHSAEYPNSLSPGMLDGITSYGEDWQSAVMSMRGWELSP